MSSQRQAEQKDFPCEPCSYRNQWDVPAVGVVGWDNTPVCEFHKSHSWSEDRSTLPKSRIVSFLKRLRIHVGAWDERQAYHGGSMTDKGWGIRIYLKDKWS